MSGWEKIKNTSGYRLRVPEGYVYDIQGCVVFVPSLRDISNELIHEKMDERRVKVIIPDVGIIYYVMSVGEFTAGAPSACFVPYDPEGLAD